MTIGTRRADGYQLAEHPQDSTALIVVDELGQPVSGKRIVVGDAEIQGDSKHSESKGPTIKDKTTGTRYRVTVDNGVLGIEEVT